MKVSRYLAIDYGEKRVGIAISDPFKMISKPYDILDNDSNVIEQLIKIIEKENIEKLIIGMPYNMNGSLGFQGETVKEFINDLKINIDLPVVEVDERMSSKRSKERLKDMKIKKKYIDDRAAADILQNFLDY